MKNQFYLAQYFDDPREHPEDFIWRQDPENPREVIPLIPEEFLEAA